MSPRPFARAPWRAEAIMREHVYFGSIVLRDHLKVYGGIGTTIDGIP